MNDMRVASMAFAAYFDISADTVSMKISFDGSRNEYISSSILLPSAESVPIITLSGSRKSFSDDPSRRNSGFDAMKRL